MGKRGKSAHIAAPSNTTPSHPPPGSYFPRDEKDVLHAALLLRSALRHVAVPHILERIVVLARYMPCVQTVHHPPLYHFPPPPSLAREESRERRIASELGSHEIEFRRGICIALPPTPCAIFGVELYMRIAHEMCGWTNLTEARVQARIESPAHGPSPGSERVRVFLDRQFPCTPADVPRSIFGGAVEVRARAAAGKKPGKKRVCAVSVAESITAHDHPWLSAARQGEHILFPGPYGSVAFEHAAVYFWPDVDFAALRLGEQRYGWEGARVHFTIHWVRFFPNTPEMNERIGEAIERADA